MAGMVSCCQGPTDSCPALYYDPDINRFVDEDGQIIIDMHEILDPWQILHMKETGKESGYCVLPTKSGGIIEAFFPSPWSENTYWNFLKQYHDDQQAYYRYAMDKEP